MTPIALTATQAAPHYAVADRNHGMQSLVMCGHCCLWRLPWLSLPRFQYGVSQNDCRIYICIQLDLINVHQKNSLWLWHQKQPILSAIFAEVFKGQPVNKRRPHCSRNVIVSLLRSAEVMFELQSIDIRTTWNSPTIVVIFNEYHNQWANSSNDNPVISKVRYAIKLMADPQSLWRCTFWIW